MISNATISMPAVGTYGEVAEYLRISKNTLYKMTCIGQLKPGIYIGNGRFNLSKLRDCIEQGGYVREQEEKAMKLQKLMQARKKSLSAV